MTSRIIDSRWNFNNQFYGDTYDYHVIGEKLKISWPSFSTMTLDDLESFSLSI